MKCLCICHLICGCGGSDSSSGSNDQVTADTIAPVITLLGETSLSLEQGVSYSDAGATANDNKDGDISATIAVNNTVDSSTVGVYQVIFNVSDAAGNAATQVVRTVTITAPSGTSSEKWSLVWSDEFGDNTVDPQKWSYMIGDGTDYGETRGWGNDEKQYYTQDSVNSGIAIDQAGNSVLYIDATATPNGVTEYASAKLTTEDLFEFRFGKVEARIKLPETKGIWPAFWMLGANKPDIGWPGSGEIDIMEMIGNAEQTVHGTVHYVNSENEHRLNGDSNSLTEGKYSDDYHLYAIEWTPEDITWFVDGEQYHKVTIAADMKEFLREHYLILNVAVGGYWPGYPDQTTVLPQRMAVDYVRVYQDTTLVVPEAPVLVAEEETMGLANSDALAAINSSFAPFQNIKIVTYGPGSPEPTVSTVSAEGSTSILASFPGDQWGGMYFELDDLIDATAYQTGNLVVMLDVPEEIADFEVKLEGATGFGSLNLLDYTPEPVDSIYQKYTIPLADFVAAGTTFDDMKIPFALWNPMNADGDFVAGNVLIDNIYFELAE
jgi:beta-glucanase (GH16 family)